MKIFIYAMREYDELKYFEEYKKSLGFEYSYTTEYPFLENADLAKGYDGINILTNHINKELLDKYKSLGIKYIATRTIGYGILIQIMQNICSSLYYWRWKRTLLL